MKSTIFHNGVLIAIKTNVGRMAKKAVDNSQGSVSANVLPNSDQTHYLTGILKEKRITE
jgi:hypothetical protein